MDSDFVSCIYLCMTGILVSVYSMNVCLPLLLCVFEYTSPLDYIRSLSNENCKEVQLIELNNKINKSINSIHNILLFYMKILYYLFIDSFVAHKSTRWYQRFEFPGHLIVQGNSYCICAYSFKFSLLLLLLNITVILYILMSQLPVQLCHMWPVVYIITIISISLGYILYNILLTSLLSSLLILKAISVPVWDYWHAAYSYVCTWLYSLKVNTIIVIHVYTYYISYMSTFYMYVFTFKLLYFYYMSQKYRKMNRKYYSDFMMQMYMISCDYNALSHYLIMLNHG